jgi:hypothetical protein
MQLLAWAGFDWLVVDLEHGPISIETAHAMIAATSGTAVTPLVRVPQNLPWLPSGPLMPAPSGSCTRSSRAGPRWRRQLVERG